ncbi:MAG: hypothetical protein VYE73_17215 [Acidobacteriota bacterium]|nr:hypothetical protein [Acidobacteriota bacterium]
MNARTHRKTTWRVLVASTLLFTVAGAGQAAEYEMPRTPWGHPDLQGTFTNGSQTPFERPEALGDKAFFTEEEIADLVRQKADAVANAANRAPDRTSEGGQVGGYNQHWMDPQTNVVGTRRTSLVIDPPNGRVPVRPEAIADRDSHLSQIGDHWTHLGPWDRCITRGVPGGFFQSGYNNNYILMQTPDTVAIHFEMIHNTRIIPLGERPLLPEDMQLWNGDSRGHWDGDTLVVETRNLSDKGWIASSGFQRRIRGIAQTRDTHVIERFTRLDDDTIDYQVTITDPAIYTAPWTAQIPLYTQPDLVLFEYACHEGNWAVHNTLSGGRADDRETGASGD